MRIRLSDEDRERLGLAQEWITFDAARLMVLDAEALEDAGYDPEEFLGDVVGRPVLRDGKPVMVPELDDDGNEVLVDGQPKLVPKTKRPVRAMRAVIWLAARRAGVTAPFETFDYRADGVTITPDEEPQGKAPGAEPAADEPVPASGS